MIALSDLIAYLNELLVPMTVSDYCPNGLQVAGREKIGKIITGVTACQELLEEALAEKADAVLVHHGYFWKNENPCITGIKYNRLHTLLQHGINLLAYHLPLDLHPEYGNNVQLARVLDLKITGRFRAGGIEGLGFLGALQSPMSGEDFADYVAKKLQRTPTHIAADRPIKTIAWCTGAAHSFLEDAIAQGVDAYLTGELAESSVHLARESGVHLFGAGHHATERYGVAALGEHLAQHFHLQHRFIDIDNPV